MASGRIIPRFEDVCVAVAEIRGIPPESVAPGSLLVEDLGFDSMDLVELLAVLVSYGAENFPIEGNWLVKTVQMVYSDLIISLQPL